MRPSLTFLIFISLFTITIGAAAQSKTKSQCDSTSLRKSLNELAAKKYGNLQISSSAKEKLDSLINIAVSDTATFSSNSCRTVIQNFSKLIDETLKNKERVLGVQGVRYKITNNSVKKSFSICPLYPFCK